MRIGHGYDVHRLTAGRKLILGGVEIPFELGLEGHSDADVLLHAVMDALLGAAGLRDIGQHFPDTDPRYKGISSRKLLAPAQGQTKGSRQRSVQIDRDRIAGRIIRMPSPFTKGFQFPFTLFIQFYIADLNGTDIRSFSPSGRGPACYRRRQP